MSSYAIRRWLFVAVTFALSCSFACRAEDKALSIYFIDVEGGQSTLIVTPQGESLLVDAGYAGNGGPDAKAGDPALARDANRIVAAAHDAGIDRIDYLLVTHFHADHIGGVPELAKLLPIQTFIDHGTVPDVAEKNVKGTLAVFAAYAAVRSGGKHIEPQPGDRLPLSGVNAVVVSSAGKTIAKPLPAIMPSKDKCPAAGNPAQEPNENPRSTGFRLQYGKFTFLDIGDLSGPPLFALACPQNLVGPVDVYLVAHHGGRDAAEPATLSAFRPRVAILNNGTRKGGAPETFDLLHTMPSVETWQLHRSDVAADKNFADERVANLNEQAAHWLKLTAHQDGSFSVFNPRTQHRVDYPAR